MEDMRQHLVIMRRDSETKASTEDAEPREGQGDPGAKGSKSQGAEESGRGEWARLGKASLLEGYKGWGEGGLAPLPSAPQIHFPQTFLEAGAPKPVCRSAPGRRSRWKTPLSPHARAGGSARAGFMRSHPRARAAWLLPGRAE